MKNITNPWEGKQIRSLYEPAANTWWFSAIDICAVLTNSNYIAARKYWKNLKFRLILEGSQLVTECNQLRLQSRDGKMRHTDVLTIKQILYLIQIIPNKEAEPFRLWLAEAAASGSAAKDQLLKIGAENTKITMDEIKEARKDDGKPYERRTTMRRDIRF